MASKPEHYECIISDQADEIKRLKDELQKWVVIEECDYPGDAPEVVGYSCLICKAEGDTKDELIHMGDCPLYDFAKDAAAAGETSEKGDTNNG